MVYPPLTGDQDYKENVHLSQFTADLLAKYVKREGFEVLRLRGEGDYRGIMMPLQVFTRVFPSRGGVIHLTAQPKGKNEVDSLAHPLRQ